MSDLDVLSLLNQRWRTVLSISASVHLADVSGQTIQNNGKVNFKFYIQTLYLCCIKHLAYMAQQTQYWKSAEAVLQPLLMPICEFSYSLW